MSYVFSFTLFSLPLIFTLHWWPLAFLILSPPQQNLHVVLPATKCLLLSKLNTLDNTVTETISAIRFRLYWTLVVSAFQDAGGYAISCQNNFALHLGCYTCWVSYFTLVCLWCGRLLLFADWPEKIPIRSRQCKRFWNWFVKNKCLEARLDLIVNFQHEHFIVSTSFPWVSEDGDKIIRLNFVNNVVFKRVLPVLA